MRTEHAEPITDDELLAALPRTYISHDNKEYYRNLLDRRLCANRCRDCGRWHHPPRPLCPDCLSWNVELRELGGRGTVALLTWIHQGPNVIDGRPYPIIAVELDEQEGLRITATIVAVDTDAEVLGARVQLTWIERQGVPLPAFTIVGEGVG